MFQAGEQKRARMPLSTPVELWMAYIWRFTARTQKHYKMVIRRFVVSVTVTELEEIIPRHIQDYLTGVLAQSTPRTANAHLTVLKSFFRWAADYYEIENPAEKIKMLREDPPNRRFLSKQQYLNVLAVADGQADTIQFIANSGLRASELRKAHVTDDKNWLIVNGKGRKQRRVPTNTVIRNILLKYPCKPETPINFSKSDRRSLYKLCRKIGKQAGIHLNPQMLRRYFANQLLEHNVSLAKISYLLGHASISTTELYLDHKPDVTGATDVLCE